MVLTKAEKRAWRREHNKIPRVRERLQELKRENMRRRRADPEFRKKENEKRRKKNLNNKITVITHYSNGKVRCRCCGQADLHFLTINGIKGEVKKTKKIKPGREVYAQLIREKLPHGYQVLCFNCCAAYGFFGFCPHKTNR